ncbi:DUF3152 domain-containing protein [Streptomyces sp. NPDC086669]|uniref:DUF3152 domain-containing protein n=1 Tax=Streptomyces sp. NPDC086669 TaxID=3365753 RepID=UPI003824FD6F
MGRHSRRGLARRDAAETTARQDAAQAPPEQGPPQGRPSVPGPGRPSGAPTPPPARRGGPPAYGGQPYPAAPTPPHGSPRLPDGTPAQGTPRLPDGTPARGVPRPAQGGPRPPDGTPSRGVPRFADGTPARGVPRLPDGTPARGVPRLPEGTPARGVPRLPDGTPARGVPRYGDGTPARGVPMFPDGTPARGVPRFADGTPAHGVPRARGGHPEQREPGGGWGELRGRTAVAHGTAATGAPVPRPRQAPGSAGPRQEFVDAFDTDTDVPAPHTAERAYPPAADRDTSGVADDAPPTGVPAAVKGGRGRAFTGVAAAAVVTVLAVVVAGQAAQGQGGTGTQAGAAEGGTRDSRDAASRTDDRPTPSATPLTYDQKMGRRYALAADATGSGKFDAVPGTDKAPGGGRKFTYRVDVERGLGLDAELFAEAVQKTLNDKRSWAHGGARTFERVHDGDPDFVITLASPGTTADWCAKSGLDTTEDNVSCDSAATERVMINAYRWAQGSETYGDHIHAYRQMLINHEIGHRLGFGHVTCDKDGELAPVMQQQTKFLDHDGISCKANPWAFPGS